MKFSLSPLSVERFLSDYWQQKPVLIKGGLQQFDNPLTPDDLAGLATEANIESRVIHQTDDGWRAESGPFDNYDCYGDSHWSLVVQSVNHWVPEAQALARLFDFIPQWRFDDVMVSFAAPDGGVGPHVDNYDVFICQGSGQRRWRVGAYGDYTEKLADEKLLHVEPFNAVIDEVVSAGDVLYIPPGFPHEGISLDSSMSFSVGYKSVNSTELLSGFADYLIDFATPQLLSDKQRRPARYGQITADDVALLQQLLSQTLEDKNRLSDFLGIYYSQSRSELDLAEDEYDYSEWLTQFQSMPLTKLYAVKTMYLPDSIAAGVFYVDGERQQLSAPVEMLQYLCDAAVVNYEAVSDETVLRWLWESTNRGYWYFEL
ncbi:MAG: cupin [Gammaproteobacteria bacterium]|nr:MAG: cupin [Gammaproteobacteria bacterium]